MNRRGIEMFVTAATLLNFRRAAEELGVSQPALSYQIAQLEQEVGAPLFVRGGRGVSLTDAGSELVAALPSILTAYDAAIGRARLASRRTTTAIRLSWPEIILPVRVVSELMRSYAAASQGTITVVTERRDPVHMLVEGTADVALAFKDSFDRLPSARVTDLFDMVHCCLVARDSPLARLRSIGWDGLAGQTVYQRRSTMRPAFYAALLHAIGQASPGCDVVLTDDDETASVNVAAGNGVTFRPVIRGLVGKEGDGMVAVPIHPLETFSMSAVFVPTGSDEQKELFCATAQKRARELGL